MLAKRLAVVFLLKEGFSYANISEALKITPVTIGKIRLISKSRKPRTTEILSLMEKRRSLGEALKDLGIFRKQHSL